MVDNLIQSIIQPITIDTMLNWVTDQYFLVKNIGLNFVMCEQGFSKNKFPPIRLSKNKCNVQFIGRNAQSLTSAFCETLTPRCSQICNSFLEFYGLWYVGNQSFSKSLLNKCFVYKMVYFLVSLQQFAQVEHIAWVTSVILHFVRTKSPCFSEARQLGKHVLKHRTDEFSLEIWE